MGRSTDTDDLSDKQIESIFNTLVAEGVLKSLTGDGAEMLADGTSVLRFADGSTVRTWPNGQRTYCDSDGAASRRLSSDQLAHMTGGTVDAAKGRAAMAQVLSDEARCRAWRR